VSSGARHRRLARHPLVRLTRLCGSLAFAGIGMTPILQEDLGADLSLALAESPSASGLGTP